MRETMEAGRAFDTKVAELVVGRFGYPNRIPQYSSYMGAAWAVVEKMETLGWDATVIVCADGFVVTFAREGDKHTAIVRRGEGTAPLAICRAALASVEPSDAR